jgi:hypothetical protein
MNSPESLTITKSVLSTSAVSRQRIEQDIAIVPLLDVQTRKVILTKRGWPSAYVHTLPYRPIADNLACPGPHISHGEATRVLAIPELLLNIVNALFEDLHCTDPRQLRTTVEPYDWAALDKMLWNYLDNLGRLQRNTGTVLNAISSSSILRRPTAITNARISASIKTMEEFVATQNERLFAEAREHEPFKSLDQAIGVLRAILAQRSMSTRQVTDALFSLEMMARTESMYEITRSLTDAQKSWPDESAHGCVRHALSDFAARLDNLYADLPRPTSTQTAQDTIVVLRNAAKGVLCDAHTLEQLANALAFNKVDEIDNVRTLLFDLMDFRIYHDHLRKLQHRETEVAIRNLASVNHRTLQIMSDGLSSMLPAALSRRHLTVTRDESSLYFASRWIENRNVLTQFVATMPLKMAAIVKRLEAKDHIGSETMLRATLLYLAGRHNDASLAKLVDYSDLRHLSEKAVQQIWFVVIRNSSFSQESKVTLTMNLLRTEMLPNAATFEEAFRQGVISRSEMDIAVEAIRRLRLLGHVNPAAPELD